MPFVGQTMATSTFATWLKEVSHNSFFSFLIFNLSAVTNADIDQHRSIVLVADISSRNKYAFC